jgi:hypothetical protein
MLRARGGTACPLSGDFAADMLPTGVVSADGGLYCAGSNGPRLAGAELNGTGLSCSGSTCAPHPAQYRGDSPTGIPQFGQNRIPAPLTPPQALRLMWLL